MKVCGDPRFPTTLIKIPIPAYGKTQVQTYFDLAYPGKLNPEYSRYNPLPIKTGTTKAGLPALGASNSKAIYAREHVYEQSMSALFVDYLKQIPDLWLDSAGTNQFCDWVIEHLLNPTAYYPGVPVYPVPTVFEDIGNCYPGGKRGGNAMVILEHQSNMYKNKLMYATESQLNKMVKHPLIKPDTFSKYCVNTQVSKLRAAAGVASYMNDHTVKENFLHNNACIRDVWSDWYAKYLTSNVDAPNKATVNVPNIYDNWISDVVNGMVPFLRLEIESLILLYNDGLTTAADVDLSFAILLDNVNILNTKGQPIATGNTPFTSARPTTRQELTDNILKVIPDITWAKALPRH
ncbi:hypothetical protein H2248_002076 [Termitomyces sp. 'cryptogamus']|nr:hypothetical protein H2248_002076 [Termitomyces sp. 'cryptogamus']